MPWRRAVGRGLELAIIDAGFAELRDALTGVTNADPTMRMYESGLAYRRIAKAHPQVYRLMFGPNPSDPALANPALALDALLDTILYAQVAGILRPGSPQVMAKNVWASIHGAVILELETANATDERRHCRSRRCFSTPFPPCATQPPA